MTRLLINEGIKKKSEEDLIRILTRTDSEPEEFNFSPYILRCINEKLLEKGFSIGMGEITSKSKLDQYWENVVLPIETDVLIRVINGEKVTFSWEVIILMKNSTIRDRIWHDLEEIKKINPRNDRVFRGSISKFENFNVDELLSLIQNVLEKKSISFSVENFEIVKETMTIDSVSYDFILPVNIYHNCKNCNMCELPSNYSINPIPNKCEQPYSKLYSDKRIGFPSNLASMTVEEGKAIGTIIRENIEEFSKLAILIADKDEKIIDFQLVLKQLEGVCIFQDLRQNLCKIHNYSPLSCKSFPYLINKVEKDFFTVEIDYTCPGLKEGQSFFKENFTKEIHPRLISRDVFHQEYLEDISKKMDLSNYYGDCNRVTKEDIEKAQSYLFEDLEEN